MVTQETMEVWDLVEMVRVNLVNSVLAEVVDTTAVEAPPWLALAEGPAIRILQRLSR